MEHCKQLTACTFCMEMSLKLRRCCEYVFMFKCFDPSGNKTIPWETVAGGFMLISSKKTWGKLPSHPLFCSLAFLLLWWFSVVCTGASCTGAEPELPPAGGGVGFRAKPNFTAIGVICKTAPPSSSSAWPSVWCGRITFAVQVTSSSSWDTSQVSVSLRGPKRFSESCCRCSGLV